MINHHILAIAITLEESEADVRLVALSIECCKHPHRLLVQLHRLGSLRPFFFWETGQPAGAATVAAMDVGNGRKARREVPCVEEVQPVDVGRYFGYLIV